MHIRRFSSRARYPSGVPRGPNGLRSTEHPNHIKRRELYESLKNWIPIVQKYAAENPVGPIFFGPTAPFPYNPEFKNTIPISDNMKNLVYETYKSGPAFWTVRRLSRAFFLSIERIEGILKLKKLQNDMVERGFVIDRDYISRMEMAMGVNSKDHLPFAKKLSSSSLEKDGDDNNEKVFSYRIQSILEKPAQSMKPFFVKIPEGQDLTPEQAGAILERDLLVARDYFSTRPLVEDEEVEHRVIRNDPYEKSKTPYVIVDIGPCANPRERTMYIRDINGDLREATDIERIAEAKRIWGVDAPKLLRPKSPYSPSRPRPFPSASIPKKYFQRVYLKRALFPNLTIPPDSQEISMRDTIETEVSLATSQNPSMSPKETENNETEQTTKTAQQNCANS